MQLIVFNGESDVVFAADVELFFTPGNGKSFTYFCNGHMGHIDENGHIWFRTDESSVMQLIHKEQAEDYTLTLDEIVYADYNSDDGWMTK